MSRVCPCASMVAEPGSEPWPGDPAGRPEPGSDPGSVDRADVWSETGHTGVTEHRRAMAAAIRTGTVKSLIAMYTVNKDAASIDGQSANERKSTNIEGVDDQNFDETISNKDEHETKDIHSTSIFDDNGRMIEEDLPPGLEDQAADVSHSNVVRVSLDDQMLTLNVDDKTKVSDLKQRLCAILLAKSGKTAGASPADLWLTAPPGRPLHDEQLVAEQNIRQNEAIVVNLRLRGGAPPRALLPEHVSPQGARELVDIVNTNFSNVQAAFIQAAARLDHLETSSRTFADIHRRLDDLEQAQGELAEGLRNVDEDADTRLNNAVRFTTEQIETAIAKVTHDSGVFANVVDGALSNLAVQAGAVMADQEARFKVVIQEIYDRMVRAYRELQEQQQHQNIRITEVGGPSSEQATPASHAPPVPHGPPVAHGPPGAFAVGSASSSSPPAGPYFDPWQNAAAAAHAHAHGSIGVV